MAKKVPSEAKKVSAADLAVANILAPSLDRIAHAITPDAMPGTDESGGSIMSLTEAVMGITAGLFAVAAAINNLAEAQDTDGE